jgi:hypothetical protein
MPASLIVVQHWVEELKRLTASVSPWRSGSECA